MARHRAGAPALTPEPCLGDLLQRLTVIDPEALRALERLARDVYRHSVIRYQSKHRVLSPEQDGPWASEVLSVLMTLCLLF